MVSKKSMHDFYSDRHNEMIPNTIPQILRTHSRGKCKCFVEGCYNQGWPFQPRITFKNYQGTIPGIGDIDFPHFGHNPFTRSINRSLVEGRILCTEGNIRGSKGQHKRGYSGLVQQDFCWKGDFYKMVIQTTVHRVSSRRFHTPCYRSSNTKSLQGTSGIA